MRTGEQSARGWEWAAALTLAVVFFLATHDLLAAFQWQQALPEEVRQLVREVSEGRMQRQLAFPLLAFVGVLGLLRHSRLRFRPDPYVMGLLGAFLAWQFLSVAWAADPLLTAKRLLVLGMMVVGAAGLMRHLTPASLLRALALCASLHLVAGVGTELWLGTFDPFQTEYRFAGTLHPNQQGINCALLAVSALFLVRGARSARGRALAFALLLTALSFLLLTRSRTALAAAVLALLAFLIVEAPPVRRIGLVVGGAMTAVLLALLQANGVMGAAGSFLLLGRDDSSLTTLTGRTDIWSFGLRYAAERPVTGYGYNSFWSPRHTAEVSEVVDWKISEGHSAYLDTLLNLGAVGLLLLVSVMGIALLAALSRYRATRDPAVAAVGAIIVFGALDGVLESAVVIPNLLSFVTLAVLIGFSLNGEAIERPVEQPVGMPLTRPRPRPIRAVA